MIAPRPAHPEHSGFTLVELSIALVIIALLAAGVIAGKSLIEAAELRKVIREVDQWKTTVNAFRTKYGALPGDLANDAAGKFGFFQGVSPNYAGNQDGQINLSAVMRGESSLFWRHLYDAGMNATRSFCNGCPSTLDVYGTPSNVSTDADMASTWPLASINGGNRYTAFALNGVNYFQIVYFVPGTPVSNRSGITPIQAKSVDDKADDGNPASGTIQAMDNGSTPTTPVWCCWAGFPSALLGLPAQSGTSSQNYCLFTGGQTYNTAGSSATQQTCQLRFDME